MKTDSKKIVVAGGGLVGCLIALRLLQRGFDVSVFEQREDMRQTPMRAGRSINLALSPRGIRALALCGLDEKLLSQAIAMKGRLVHSVEGSVQFQAYSVRPGDCIHSISRGTLNCSLLDAIDALKPGALHFNQRLTRIEEDGARVIFENAQGQPTELCDSILIASDGAGSAARKWMLSRTPGFHFSYSQHFQDYGYKELTIGPRPDGGFALQGDVLHIWPRGHFMMIALPNPDKSFTATLFLPYQGKEGFNELNTNERLLAFLSDHFPDATGLIENPEAEFFNNPTGYLYTVKCKPWHYGERILLIGDAAHAIIPFYGQGMNCGFEDVGILDKLLDQFGDWHSLFASFSSIRKPNGDAIADLAEDNFLEMRDKVADPVFQEKRKLELRLEQAFPEYYSKYSMVTFRPDLSYYTAMVRGRQQDAFLMDVCKTGPIPETDAQLQELYRKLQEMIKRTGE
ncbi:MAG: FAD-dependent monooxygenase [Saprospiraceae bacterium]|jgi:kynurenine 3-monooxygenase|nr:FAD-dependent monooxygenase [Saprospiraceae bacterium]MBP9210163.1 FAD-dependent monooxygenase [Saprospiraceae bacterium]MBV6473490.1 Kynurenine 3-monooxygenase [Saprospiraceae bacterium]